MSSNFNPIRYSIITEKNPREILMLRGSGCKWRRCTFCDYHLDYSKDEAANYALNASHLAQVTGIYHKLEVINSGSIVDLDSNTLHLIRQTCIDKKIEELHFECHWMHRKELPAVISFFEGAGITVKVKIGVETFDAEYRESYLCKGIDETEPARIAQGFHEVCLLFGLDGQTVDSMRSDIETGLANFERVCVNLMVENTTRIKPNQKVLQNFLTELYPVYKDNERVDILIENTDFGVGKEQ
ncbi:MAG: radical SAM protein [Lachnospiraceae bacterium]|nr:radical SAM protein [Lachnospiraceae bacterium]MDD3615509.1 radical SAM protein [Lachnospiraceae bacterium]